MLRAVLLFVCLIAVIALVAGATNAGWPTLPFAVIPGILALLLVFERFIYKPIRSSGRGRDGTGRRNGSPIRAPGGTSWFITIRGPVSGAYVAEPGLIVIIAGRGGRGML